AGREQLQAPDRVTSVHEVAPRLGTRLALMPAILPHELLLFRDVRLPEKAGDLVIAGPDPMEQVLDTRGRIGDAEGVPDPITHLLSVVKRSAGDLGLELCDLGRPELARVAAVVERAQFVQAAIAED